MMDLSDTSKHVPWIVFEARGRLEAYLAADMRVLEWGSGGSTLYFCKRVKEVVSIEHDPDWFANVSRALVELALTNCSYHLIEPRKNALLRYAPYHATLYNSRTFARYRPYSFRTHVEKCEAYPDEHFDLVLVDGRARASCLRHAIRRLRAGGMLMLDNSERAQYRREMAKLEHLKLVDFYGRGPFLDEPWQTTIWFRGQETAQG